MKVSTVTGAAGRDYFLLSAETTQECGDLVRIHLSHFVPPGLCDLFGTDYTVQLRVYFRKDRAPGLDAETRAALDTTP